ncbi:MAG: hypothetical protein ACI4IG_02180 [Eubacterium sp.]
MTVFFFFDLWPIVIVIGVLLLLGFSVIGEIASKTTDFAANAEAWLEANEGVFLNIGVIIFLVVAVIIAISNERVFKDLRANNKICIFSIIIRAICYAPIPAIGGGVLFLLFIDTLRTAVRTFSTKTGLFLLFIPVVLYVIIILIILVLIFFLFVLLPISTMGSFEEKLSAKVNNVWQAVGVTALTNFVPLIGFIAIDFLIYKLLL